MYILLPTWEHPSHSTFANIAIIPKKRRASLMGEKWYLVAYVYTSLLVNLNVSMFYWSFVCLICWIKERSSKKWDIELFPLTWVLYLCANGIYILTYITKPWKSKLKDEFFKKESFIYFLPELQGIFSVASLLERPLGRPVWTFRPSSSLLLLICLNSPFYFYSWTVNYLWLGTVPYSVIPQQCLAQFWVLYMYSVFTCWLISWDHFI